MLWIVYRWREREPPYRPILRRRNLSLHPCPPVMASGAIGPASQSEYWLEEDGMPEPAAAAVEKPPYRIPTLEEIRAVPWNGLNVVSAFSGAGGSSTGYRMAGYRVLAAVEFVPIAAESYRLNAAPYTKVLERDVRELDAAELLEAIGMEPGELDLLDGSPPCEPFSSAGKRDATWRKEVAYSGQVQRTDDLFLEFARLVDGVRPRAFVAENVEGLIKGRAKGYFKIILRKLRSLGYRVEARVLDAQWLGTAQVRKRLIFVGVREDLGRDPAFPSPLPYNYTTREAIADLIGGGRVEHDTQGQFGRKGDVTDQVPPAVLSSGAGNFKVVHDSKGANQARGAGVDDEADRPSRAITKESEHHLRVVEKDDADGGARLDPAFEGEGLEIVSARGGHKFSPKKIDPDQPHPTMVSGSSGPHPADQTSGTWVEYDEQIVGNEAFEPVFGPLDQPSPTIMAGGARTSGEVRSSETRRRRKLTIDEVKRICGFPDDYRLAGGFSKQWERMGDSVAPQMAAAVGAALRDNVLLPKEEGDGR